MQLPVFSVYDSKALTFSHPHVQPNSDVAVRAFAQAANSPGNAISDHPDDYSLFQVGIFDDETGIISPVNHVNHGLANSFIKRG